MMTQKHCPDCGAAMDAILDICPHCGLEGLNQLFLSEEDYDLWVKTVLDPRRRNRIVPLQVFAGPHHCLILRQNGDLYAYGNNRNGCCGENLPEELTAFTRIARRVIHAAAGKDHTLYVTNEGKVKLLGNSEYAERFTCDLRASRVFAHPEHDAFLIEDTGGGLHFFGSRVSVGLIDLVQKTLHTFPRVKKRVHRVDKWSLLVSYPAQYTWNTTTSILEGFQSPEDYPEVREALSSDWYRAFVQEYGPDNVSIEMGKILESELVEKKHIPYHGGPGPDSDTVTDQYYAPEVVLTNNRIYTPQPIPAGRISLNTVSFRGCWPDQKEYWWYQDSVKDARKVMFGTSDLEPDTTKILAFIDAEGKATVPNPWLYDYKTLIPVEDVQDIAISPEPGEFCRLLLVKQNGEVYWADPKKLQDAARRHNALDRLIKTIPMERLLTRIVFPGV